MKMSMFVSCIQNEYFLIYNTFVKCDLKVIFEGKYFLFFRLGAYAIYN